jgi:hypothetical protein
VRPRRISLVLSLAAPLLAAEVQSAENVPTVGYLLIGSSECKMTARDEAFYGGLRDLGYVPGQTITVDRKCFGTGDEMRNLLSGFVDRKIDVIFVGAPVA